ncbi:MAG: hypothetical protein M3Y91_10115 [Actinomycetota bacterium]|nr:hypothetical protein [Actinomycetota bacterium]
MPARIANVTAAPPRLRLANIERPARRAGVDGPYPQRRPLSDRGRRAAERLAAQITDLIGA